MGQIYISNWKTEELNCRPVKYKSHWNTARAKLNCPVIVFHWPDCNMPIIKSKGVIIDIFIVVIIIISLIRPWCCFHNQCCSKMLSLSRLFPNLALTIIRWQITREAIKFRKKPRISHLRRLHATSANMQLQSELHISFQEVDHDPLKILSVQQIEVSNNSIRLPLGFIAWEF